MIKMRRGTDPLLICIVKCDKNCGMIFYEKNGFFLYAKAEK